ncbi:hypothetical protein AAG570_001958 [Ranatra chinensis]|uniref:Carboxypeptidase Q n=1 Tax=Ranatra chinensis TaxID=642074 RepID=A0ABD0YA26_9HEMI
MLSSAVVVLAVAATAALSSPVTNRVDDAPRECGLPDALRQEIAGYRPTVERIVAAVTQGPAKGKVWKELAQFVDKFGPRLSGTEVLERSIDHVLGKMRSFGLDNVHGEPVEVVHWDRGLEEAEMLEPRPCKLPILGLGGSVGTPPGGITAQVVAVESFDELKQVANQARGKVLVFAQKYESYGKTVPYRQYAAVEGAKVGAVATLVSSITPFSISTLHTGWQDYSDNVTKIPTASITKEDAEMFLRMYRRGDKVVVKIKMGGRMLDPVMSRNSVGEVLGKTEPEKVVIVSGHMDSWDVGTGAMDDGGGAFISWYSLALIKMLNLPQPRRTIRAVLWTGEEEGLIGAFAYAKAHKNELNNFNLLMESDEGTFTPSGLEFKGSSQAQCIMQNILKLLDSINGTTLQPSDDVGSDIMVWSKTDVPLASLRNDNDQYFWFHHSAGDRMTVEQSDALDKSTALWAAVAYVVADLSVDIPKNNEV